MPFYGVSLVLFVLEEYISSSFFNLQKQHQNITYVNYEKAYAIRSYRHAHISRTIFIKIRK